MTRATGQIIAAASTSLTAAIGGWNLISQGKLRVGWLMFIASFVGVGVTLWKMFTKKKVESSTQ